ncbi:MAG TPA: hypothetical protein VK327_10255, partial [Candidatus Paceibacterota bacterium]|nr:hypothetical protein [Candidatus Paceibacterota bacterium]
LGAQSMAFDFVQGIGKRPLILEVSFGFASQSVYDCGGFWDDELKWHECPTWPEHAIVEDVLKAVESRRLETPLSALV